MEITDQLKKTRKGQLIYKREKNRENIKELLEDASSPYKLRHSHNEGPVSVQSNESYEDKENTAVNKPEKKDSEKSPPKEERSSLDMKSKLSDISQTISRFMTSDSKPAVSPEYDRSNCLIKEYENMWDNKAKAAVRSKQLEFIENSKKLPSPSPKLLQEQEEKHMDRMKQLYEEPSQLHIKKMAEINKLNELRKLHRTHKKKLDDKLQEGERKLREMEEEERKRLEKLENLQKSMQKVHTEIKSVTAEFGELCDGCAYKQYFDVTVNKLVDLMKQIKEMAEQIVSKQETTNDLLDKLNNILDRARNALDCLKQQIEQANEKGKSEELRKQLEEEENKTKAAQQNAEQDIQNRTVTTTEPQQQSEPVAQLTDCETGQTVPQAAKATNENSVLEEVVTEFFHGHMHVKEVEKTLAGFISNPQMKKVKFSLQKAVNVPINAISPQSGAHLRSQIQKLLHLLGGSQVEVSGKHISAKEIPEGLLFVKNLIAKMIVKKGEEQVTSNYESAFSIAVVAVGLWQEHADVGKLLLHHFQVLCPYIVPCYFPRQEGMSLQDYHRILGYKTEDGNIEAQDKFLKRMSGVMRLYAAILISSPPNINQPHPHGLEHAWIWLSRTLNMDPQPDITATMLFDMLQVTGHALFYHYKVQFVKLIYLLYKDFLPKIKSVAAAGGPVVRLENFLETLLKNLKNRIPPQQPNGYLSPNFLFS